MAGLTIDYSREGDRLKVSAFEGRTFEHYDYVQFHRDDTRRACRQIVRQLGRSASSGPAAPLTADPLRRLGQDLYDQLIPLWIRERLQAGAFADLTFNLEDRLVLIPWELLHDGEQFLCRKYNLGRTVKSRQRVSRFPSRKIGHPPDMLILCDPEGNLPEAYREGVALRNALDEQPERVRVAWKGNHVTGEYVRRNVRDFDILHYAGHARYHGTDPSRSGWSVRGGSVSAGLFARMTGQPLPSLVFSNACRSGDPPDRDTGEPHEAEIFGLANAFLLAGVRHYIGTFWDVLDEEAAHLAAAFYRSLIQGRSVGESLRRARAGTVERFGEENGIWASYLLYGDPGVVYFPEKEAPGTGGLPGSSPAPEPVRDPAPFIVGPPVSNPAGFFGRERVLNRLFGLWKHTPMQNAAIVGPRRSGKTSLLLYLKNVSRARPEALRPGQQGHRLPDPERLHWVYVDFQDPRMGGRNSLLGSLVSGMNLNLDPLSGGLGDRLRRVRAGEEPCTLDLFMELVSAGLETPTVILLDEMDLVMKRYPELDNGFWEALRSLATNQVRGNLGFALSSAGAPEELAHHSGLSSPFFNIFGYTTELEPLTEPESRELIGSSPVPFDTGDVEWILAQSRGWPILLQVLCRERLAALEANETGEQWREDALVQMRAFGHLLEYA